MAENTFGDIRELGVEFESPINEEARAVSQLGAELIAGRQRVFFYAASGLDWQPLHRFSHRCDCFVYVDPRKTNAEFAEARQQLVDQQTRAGDGLRTVNHGLHIGAAYDVITEATGQLAEMRDEPWTRIPNLRKRPAWGVVQRFERHVGGTRRDRWLLFISGSPLVVYRKLFIETGTAPECLALCVPQVEGEDAQLAQEWGTFAGWQGELAALIREHQAPYPTLLATNAQLGGWPLTVERYLVSKWRSAWRTPVYAAKNSSWPIIRPATEPGKRRVIVTRKPLNPHTARAVGAIVLSNEIYTRHRWPEGVLAIINAPPVYENEGVGDSPHVLNMNITGTPLLQALSRVEAVCAERGITKVAAIGLGFEDEADDLALWRQQDGQIKELIVHCGNGSDGRFMDFASAADEID